MIILNKVKKSTLLLPLLYILLPLGAYGLPMMEGQTEVLPQTSAGQPPEVPLLTLPLTEPPRSSAYRLPEMADPNAPVVYSRTAKAVVGQQVEIPFGGNGWVFLGEENGQTGVAYHSHRFDAEGQTFLFEAEAVGVYGLDFYKQDFVRDFLINDHVKVIVEAADAAASSISRSPVVAQPRWPTAVQEALWAAGDKIGAMPPALDPSSSQSPEKTASVADGGTILQEQTTAASEATTLPSDVPTSGIPEDAEPDAYIEQVRKVFDANDFISALDVLDQFRERFPVGNDEAWWLYARIFETNGPTRDVKSARYYYQRLVNEFPLSSYWTDAQNRIKYLDRYYFNIQ